MTRQTKVATWDFHLFTIFCSAITLSLQPKATRVPFDPSTGPQSVAFWGSRVPLEADQVTRLHIRAGVRN